MEEKRDEGLFLRSDPWLLLCLIYARESVDRDRLRLVGDFINRAIFTDVELDGGLVRLIQAGHAVATEDRFAPSPQVLAWYISTTSSKSRTAVRRDLERVKAFLGVRSDAC